MSLANILVHIDRSPRSRERISVAVDLATRTGARLTGVFAELATAPRVGIVAHWPPAERPAAVETARSRFLECASSLGDRADFVDLDRGGGEQIMMRVTDIARGFGLVVLGQAEADGWVPADLPEQVIVEGGRPVLVVPCVGTYTDIGRRPLFAWHDSRGAARALHDAIPLLMSNADGLVVEVVQRGEAVSDRADVPVAALAAYGVSARLEHVSVGEVGVMDTLLNHADDHAADLLVVGAFDHGSFSLTGRGAGTRHFLRHMTLPVLFSH